jgi:uncharacterized protein YjiS (DUF1127 family)
MEMHSRQSLNEIHGISAPPRRQPRWGSLMRLCIARVRAVLKGIAKAIDAELAARRAIVELASMDDRMLRDLGITRGEIKNLIRRGNVGADDGPVLSSDAGYHRPALPPISSPAFHPKGGPQQSAETMLVVISWNLKGQGPRCNVDGGWPIES